MILKQETIKSWFSGMKSSINAEVVQPFANAEQIIWKYNQAIQHNSLTQKGWERLLAQSDDSLKAYLTSIKGTTASMTGYTTSLQGNITGFKKVSLAINQYNSLATAGIQKQNEFSSAVAMTNGQLGNYLRGLNGSKASLGGYASSLVGATAKTVALQVATMALNSVLSMGLITVIQLAIQGFHKLINAAKQASEVADEVFSESNNKVQQNKEELKSLDELIAKYKELKASGELDVEGRKEVKELQNDIADLVGVQAKNLDLVNGKLDEEIKKLNEISKKEAKNAYETATANYNNSKKAVENATGDASILFVDGYAYVGDMEKEAEKILQDAGFVDYYMRGGRRQYGGRGVGNNGFSTIVFDTYDKEGNILKGAQEKADYLQSMIDVLEQNGQRATDLYAGLIKQRDNYLRYIDDQQNAANSLVDSWITYSQFSNETLLKIDVDSVESFEHYRQKMIDEIQKDEIISQMIADEILSKDDLETVINDYMATSINFSSWYEQWIKGVQNTLSNPETTISFSEVFNSSDFSEHKEELLELAKAGELTPETLESTEEYKTLLSQTGLSAESTKDKIYDLLSVQERLAGAHNGLDNLANSYEEFKELNFVTAQTLEELPAVFKSLEGYDLFSKIVGNPQSGTDAIQQAFNDIVKEYLIFIQTIDPEPLISGSIEEQQRAKDTYIANLKKMGITNAEEVVNQLSLLDYAEAEYVKYLENKNGVDLEYIESSASYNSQLINSMADGYKTDYDNWVDSLAEKQKAYNAYLAVLESTNNAWSNSSGRNTFKIDEEKLSNGSYREDELFAQGLDSATVQKIMEVQSKYKLALKESEDFKNKLKTNYMFDADIKTIFSPKDSGSGSDSSDDTTFDWIETLVDNQTNALDKLNEEIDDTYSNWTDRNKAIQDAIANTEHAIGLQGQAYEKYIAKAESIKLPGYLKERVRLGDMSIQNDVNSDTKELIDEYSEWYEKAKECLVTQEELRDSLNELNSQKFDNVKSEYESLIETTTSAEIDKYQQQLDLLDAKGLFANNSYYKGMKSLTEQEKQTLIKERNELKSILNSVKPDSEEYRNMYSDLLDIDSKINDCTKSIEEFNNSIQENNWEKFEYLEGIISRITTEAHNFIDLLSNKDLFDDNGKLNDYGNATLALHISNLNTYKQQAKDYYEQMEDLQKQLVNGAGQDVLDQFNEMLDKHGDMVKAIESEKQTILDLVKDGYDAQFDALNKLIDKKKELFNEEKTLFDYQQDIAEKTKNIASLEKRKLALSSDTSEEAKAQLQEIQVELSEAKKDLEQTEYEKMISDSEKMLDQLSDDYQTFIDERLNNSDSLLQQIIDSLSGNGEIGQTLKEIADSFGMNISDTLITSATGNTNGAINSLIKSIMGVIGVTDIGNVGGYASGTTSATKGLHWFNEKGNEIIIRKKDGAILGNFDQGDVVISNEGAKLLSAFSQNPSAFMEKFGLNYQPQIKLATPNFGALERRNMSSPSINLGGVNIVCNEVNNPQQIANEIIHNKTIERAVLTMVDSAMTGKNSLSKLRF